MADDHQRRGTKLSEDGTTVFVRLRVDRQAYEFARMWARLQHGTYPTGSAEDQLEGYLNAAMDSAMQKADWTAPLEILALYPPPEPRKPYEDDMDDGIPF